MKPSLLVLAAGMGSRYGGLKQISRFGPSGETIIEYSIYDALRAGFDKIVIVIRKSFADDFKDIVVRRAMDKADISFVFQELENIPDGYSVPSDRKKPWGTAHAVLMADQEIKSPFAVINADDFYGADPYRVISRFFNTPVKGVPEEYCLIDYMLENTLSESGSVARGICELDENGYLLNIVENKNIYRSDEGIFSEISGNKVKLTGREHVSMNIMGFLPSFFGHLKTYFKDFLAESINDPSTEFYLPVALGRIVSEGHARVRVLNTNARWFGVTYTDDREIVIRSLRELSAKGLYPADLWA